ncbi:FkbM family methyltransferase [Nostoc sp.]|uniref:FkbM family methyltransferase n=1 Tax=Nostoc sp. TaxID=1180 RepID=UPI002FFB17B7
MRNFFKNTKTILSNQEIATLYSKWSLQKFIGLDPKIKIPSGGLLGHFRHFSEFYYVNNSINNMTLKREQKLAQSLIQDGGCAFDIGANVGVFSIMMALSCHNTNIHAFEPIPSTFSILQSNIQDNHLENNIIQNKLAASNVCGYINFTDRLDSPCQNKIQISENYHFGNFLSDCITIDVYCHKKM